MQVKIAILTGTVPVAKAQNAQTAWSATISSGVVILSKCLKMPGASARQFPLHRRHRLENCLPQIPPDPIGAGRIGTMLFLAVIFWTTGVRAEAMEIVHRERFAMQVLQI